MLPGSPNIFSKSNVGGRCEGVSVASDADLLGRNASRIVSESPSCTDRSSVNNKADYFIGRILPPWTIRIPSVG